MKRKAIIGATCVAGLLVMAGAMLFQRREPLGWTLPQCSMPEKWRTSFRYGKSAWEEIRRQEVYVRKLERQERADRTKDLLRHLRRRRFREAYRVWCGKPSAYLIDQRAIAEKLCMEWGTPPENWKAGGNIVLPAPVNPEFDTRPPPAESAGK